MRDDALPDPVQPALELNVARVHTPEEAARALEAARRLSANLREAEAAGQAPVIPPGVDPTAVALVDAAQHAAEVGAAHLPAEAERVDEAIAHVMGTTDLPPPPAVARGRNLLRQALMKELSPLRAADAQAYLAVNRMPHPRPVNLGLRVFSRAMTWGAGWSIPLIIGCMVHKRRGWQAVAEVAPALLLTTAMVEYPIKTLFRRRRPFVSLVEAVVVGRRPSSYSFPSGHSASAAAGAVLLGAVYPRQRRWFRAVAALVGFSRVYLGAHFPGDVLTGAAVGAFLARIFRGILGRVFGSRKAR